MRFVHVFKHAIELRYALEEYRIRIPVCVLQSAEIFFFSKGIDRDDRWWFNATRSLWRPRRLPDWQPANYLNYILKGVEKQSGDAKRNKRPDKSVSGSDTYTTAASD
jgi:hypothetical protein